MRAPTEATPSSSIDTRGPSGPLSLHHFTITTDWRPTMTDPKNYTGTNPDLVEEAMVVYAD